MLNHSAKLPSRSPCGERGLKLRDSVFDLPSYIVAPRAGSVG